MAEDLTALATKHKDFATPQYSITLGGTAIAATDYPITDLTVVMSAGFEMSSCDFTVAPLYNLESNKFEKDIYGQFKPGKVVDVKMGYAAPLTGLFKGYINSLSFNFSASGPTVTVSCLDAKGALVNNKTFKNFDKQDIKDVVRQILNEKCSTYATIKEVASDFDANESGDYDLRKEVKNNQDDYTYLKNLAQKNNNSFCVIYDQLYFCKSLASTAVTSVKLSWGKSLLSFSTSIDISNQIGAVQVYGSDPLTQATFTSKATTITGSGETSWDMATVVKNKKMDIIDHSVTNQSQADMLAKQTLEAYSSKLVKCNGKTIGIPEVKAGDKIEIAGMGSGIDGTFFLNQVTHTFNSSGYLTSFVGTGSTVVTS